jgi:glycosyltransferase involved in cell wall biosynthesis
MPPKVSVILPNYNHARFLQQRIDSILAQTFKDYELIILDDRSSDNSREIIERYRDNKHVSHIVYNEKNSGSSFVQWNKGIGLCSGEYIWIAESDDVAHKEFLTTMVKILDENESVAIAYSQSYAIDEEGKITGNWLKLTEKLDEKKWLSDFISPGKEYIKRYLIFQNVIPNASGVLFRKGTVKKSGNPDGAYRLNGDWKFWIAMLSNADVAYVAENLNYFRSHPKTVRSTSTLQGLNFLEYTRIISYIFSNIEFQQSEKRRVVDYFHRELNYKTPITFNNLIKSYLNLARFDLYALKLLPAQIRARYLGAG